MTGVRQFDEDAFLEKALELFWRQGPAGTSMPSIAAETGVQRGSLYNAYGDKETIFLKTFDRYADRLLLAIRKHAAEKSARYILEGFVQTTINNITARGCLTTKVASDGTIANVKVRDRVRLLFAEIEAVLVASLTPYEHELNLSISETASLAIGFTRGLAVMERIHGDALKLKTDAAIFLRVVLRSRE